jgi:hypothetical protein
MNAVEVAWRVRDEPLEPCAVVARGAAAIGLATRLLECDDERLASLRGVAGPSILVLLGEANTLPWVDGVEYLGRDTRAPSLLLPVTRAPSIALQLFERAVLAQSGKPAPVAVTPGVIASVAAARPIARERLAAWAERERRGASR